MKFEDKVKSMKFTDIMQAMIDGLRNPKTEINMLSTGHSLHGRCFGCAATNTICQISGKMFDSSNISSRESRAKLINTSSDFIYCFEMAIDALRKGSYYGYNMQAVIGGFAQMPIQFILELNSLPALHTDNYKFLLDTYQDLCNKIKNYKL